jgi:phage shock protein A
MFTRLLNVIRGWFGLAVSDLEKRNPEALLELETENLRKQVGSYNQGLAAHAGLAERMMSQVRKLETEERELRASTTAHLRAGNKDAAGQYALRLQTVTRELEENRRQMAQAEETYRNLVKARDVAVNAARAKIEGLKGASNDMRMKKAMAEMN